MQQQTIPELDLYNTLEAIYSQEQQRNANVGLNALYQHKIKHIATYGTLYRLHKANRNLMFAFLGVAALVYVVNAIGATVDPNWFSYPLTADGHLAPSVLDNFYQHSDDFKKLLRDQIAGPIINTTLTWCGYNSTCSYAEPSFSTHEMPEPICTPVMLYDAAAEQACIDEIKNHFFTKILYIGSIGLSAINLISFMAISLYRYLSYQCYQVNDTHHKTIVELSEKCFALGNLNKQCTIAIHKFFKQRTHGDIEKALSGESEESPLLPSV